MSDEFKQRAEKFRENHKHSIRRFVGNFFGRDFLAELDWTEKNPPFNHDPKLHLYSPETQSELEMIYDHQIETWQTALAFVRSLLEEPKGEK